MTSKKPHIWPIRLPIIIGFITLSIMCIGLIAWGGMTQISGAIITSGIVQVENTRYVIQHPIGGSLKNIYIRNGDRVKKGDTLLKLDNQILLNTLQSLERQSLQNKIQHIRLIAERHQNQSFNIPPELKKEMAAIPNSAQYLSDQKYLFTARQNSLTQETAQLTNKLEQINLQIIAYKHQKQALTAQHELIAEELNNKELLLEKGLTNQSHVLALKREYKNLQGRIDILTANIAINRKQHEQTKIEIKNLYLQNLKQVETEIQTLLQNSITVEEQLKSIRFNLNQTIIKANTNGIVHGLAFHAPNAVIQPAEAILYIIPDSKPLVIAGTVSTRYAPQLYLGQPVTLRFSTLDNSETPQMDATLTHISADADTDRTSRSSYYTIEATPNSTTQSPIALQSGMPVDLFITTKPRTPLSYFLKPFLDYFDRVFKG